MDTGNRFIVIDDDPTSNLICQLTLEMTLGKIDIKTFTNPQEGLDYVAAEFAGTEGQTATLFLDINMPVMSGWEFLERFDELGEGIKSRVAIYILSSSVDSRDKDRSYANKNVRDHLAKPLTNKIIHAIVQHETNQIPVPLKKGLFGKGKG